MTKKQKRKFYIVVLIALLIFGKNYIFDLANEDRLQVHFIDVGQGDAIFIRTPDDKNILIDSGDNNAESKTVGYLKSNGVGTIDYLIATHPDTDHIGAMDKVVYAFDIGYFSMPIIEGIDTKNYDNLMTAIESKDITNTALHYSDVVKLSDEVYFEVLSPIKGKFYENNNGYSIIIRLVYGDTSFMFTGDGERVNEEDMIISGKDISSDVLKVGHHGSSSSSSMEFLASVDPKLAIISSGKDNKYGHPHKEVINNLEQLDIKYLNTAIEGDIVVTSDGKKIEVNEKTSVIDKVEGYLFAIFEKVGVN